MFRATGGGSESTSPWEVGVGGPKKLLHVVRDEAEAEDARAGARAALRGRG